MTEAEADKLTASALTAYRHLRAISTMTTDDRIALMALWARVFVDVEYRAADAALLRHIRTSEFFPTPAEIGRIVDEAQHGRVSAGAEAWEAVRKAFGSVGRYRDPVFADPVTTRVVAALGWRELCDSENAIADRARFIDAYDKLAADHAEDRSVAGLPGVARPALPAAIQRAHALRAAERRALSPARDGEIPNENLSPRETAAAVSAGAALELLRGGRR